MATVLPFNRYNLDFDDETTRLMGEAFDAACKGLRDTGQPIVVHSGFQTTAKGSGAG